MKGSARSSPTVLLNACMSSVQTDCRPLGLQDPCGKPSSPLLYLQAEDHRGHCEFSCLEVLWPRKLSQGNDERNSLSFLVYWRMYGTVFDVGPCPSGSDFASTIASDSY